MTGPREQIVQAIAEKPGSFAPEALVEELKAKGIGRATVYRALELLERLGMLSRMHLGAWHGYTVCDDSHHHHLVCSSCNTVVPVDATTIEADIHKLAEQLGFRVDTHTLEFAGRCADCLARSN